MACEEAYRRAQRSGCAVRYRAAWAALVEAERAVAALLTDRHDSLDAVAEACGLSSADYLRRASAYCRALGVPLARVTVGPLPAGLEVE